MSGPGDRGLEVGWVAAAHGVRGAVKVRAHNLDSEAWRVGTRLWIHERDQPELGRWYEVESLSPMPPDHLRATLVGVRARDDAEALRARTVVVDRAALPPLADDEYYLADLVGRAVVDGEGRSLGTVVGLGSNGAQDLLEVEWTEPATAGSSRRRTHRWLVPALPGFVLDVGECVHVDVPEGMLPSALEDQIGHDPRNSRD